MDSDSTKPLLLQHHDSNGALIRNYFDLELEYMVNPDYSQEESKRFIAIRSIAVLDIEKFTSDQRDAFVCFLAITFVDQFLTKSHEIPVIYSGQGCEQNVELFAFCCVSLASRLRCSDFSFINLLNKHGIAEVKDVLVMENRILESLNFQVRPLTAITFMHFFFSLLMTKDQQHSSPFNLVPQLLVAIQKDKSFTEFRPSTVAASAILVISHKLLSAKHLEFSQKILKSGCVQTEVKECFDKLKNHGITVSLLYRYKRPEVSEITYSWWSVVRLNKGKELLSGDSAAEDVAQQEPEFEIIEEVEESYGKVMYFDSSWLDPEEIRAAEERYSPMEQILICLWPICNCFGCHFGSGCWTHIICDPH